MNREGAPDGNKNAVKHSVYAFRDHGPSALEPEQRGKYAELQEQLSTRQGAIEALREQAIQTMLLAQIAQSYCVSDIVNLTHLYIAAFKVGASIFPNSGE